MKLHWFLFLFTYSNFFTPLYSQNLKPGDIAIIGYNADDPDELAFVCLTDIPEGTQINFTDNGWFNSGGFRSNEGSFIYEFTTNISAGAIINPTLSSIALASGGDQVIIYQGTDSSPSFIFALNNEGKGIWQDDATSSNTSSLPLGLINGESAIAIDEIDNTFYNGITEGTRSELLTSICDKSNWVGDDNVRQIMPINSFKITGFEATIPEPPNAFVPTNISYNSFTANWESVSGASSYFIDVSEFEDFSTFVFGFENFNVGNVLNYSITELKENSEYFYRVRAHNSAGTSTNSNIINLKTSVQPNTIVEFKNASATVQESIGVYNLLISVLYPDDLNSTSADIVLVSGNPIEIENYSTQTVTFPAGSSDIQNVTINISDDGIVEGTETLIFELQNVSGGKSAELSGQSKFTLTIVEQPGGNYYDNIDPNLTTFIYDLKNRIRNPYFQIPYSQYDETNISDFASHENGDGTKSVFCVYSNYEYNYSGTFVWDILSREHTFPHSWMPTYPADDPIEREEYSDQHHLFPAHQNNANAVRNNHPFGEVLNITSLFGEAKFGSDENGNTVYEPREEHKGDAARAIFYMIIKYDDIDGYDWGLNWVNSHSGKAAQDLNLLLSWNEQDPPNQWEIARNDYVQSIQGNRNPFVDHPEYVNYIDFYNVEYISNNPYFTEYVEGSSDNKVLEIFNNTGSTIDFAADKYKIEIYSNGGISASYSIGLTGNINDGEVFVISNSKADQAILDISDQTSGSINFNGNDAIVLLKGMEIVDVIGQIGFDPGEEWGTGEITTLNHTLRRKSSIGKGDQNGMDIFDPSVEWFGFSVDTFDGLGLHKVNSGPPTISNITQSLKIPRENEDLNILADIADDESVAFAKLKYLIDGGSEKEILMNNKSASTYEATISNMEYGDGNLLEYWIYSEDNEGRFKISSAQKVFTGITPIEKIKKLDLFDSRLIYINSYARISGEATVESGIFSSTNLDIYLQDANSGINVFNKDKTAEIVRGKNYIVEGRIEQYYGKAEIIPDNPEIDIEEINITSVKPNLQKIITDNFVEPIVMNISEFLADPETYEGMLIGIRHLVNTNGSDTWPTEGNNANIEVTGDGGITKLIIRVDKDTEIDGTPEPIWPKDIVGIFTQFDVSAPYDFGYQILPRDLNDIKNDGVLPVELTNLFASVVENSVIINWETATEVNNYGFEIERQKPVIISQNSEWKKMAFIAGSGNSNSKKNYYFTDKTANESGNYNYRLKQIDLDGKFKYSQIINVEVGVPSKFEVSQNYPNPFNPITTIAYSIPNRDKVQIIIYNMLGQNVTTLVNEEQLPGKYKYELNASNLSSGIYIYQVSAGESKSIHKMVLLK